MFQKEGNSMYTKDELDRAAGAITIIAERNGVPESCIRADMMEAINAGRSDPDPRVQAQWADFEYAGPEPTPEEFIAWMAKRVNKTMEAEYESGTLDAADAPIPS